MKIQFFSSIDGVAETYPIVKTSQELPKWTYLVREDFKKQQYAKQDIHLARCPGIFHMFAQGFIIPAWNDFEIECNDEGVKWTIAENHMNDLLEQRVILPPIEIQRDFSLFVNKMYSLNQLAEEKMESNTNLCNSMIQLLNPMT